MRAAICQTDIKFENKTQNIESAYKFINKAASLKADIVFFPEMSFTGFSLNIRRTAEDNFYTLDLMGKAARGAGINIGFGWVKINGSKAENHYSIVNTDGAVVSDYIKLHSFAIGGEKDDFISGAALPSPVRIAGHDISTFICYDLRFPEIFRASADSSSIMTVAANWPASRIGHWKALLAARAIENQSYIIGINCTGIQNGIIYCGASMAISPSGEIIAAAREYTEDMLICDIENDTAQIRRTFPVSDSRKKDFYRSILH